MRAFFNSGPCLTFGHPARTFEKNQSTPIFEPGQLLVFKLKEHLENYQRCSIDVQMSDTVRNLAYPELCRPLRIRYLMECGHRWPGWGGTCPRWRGIRLSFRVV